MNRKKIILIISLIIFAGALTYRITHPFKQKRVAELTFTGKDIRVPVKKEDVRRSKTTETSFEESLVKLEFFINPPQHSRKIFKNIFTGQMAATETEKLDNKKIPDDGMPIKTIPAAVDKRKQVENDLSLFKSFGFFESGGEKMLFIERGKQILVVRKGDRIEGKYIVKNITEKELTLTALSINEDVHIDLSQL